MELHTLGVDGGYAQEDVIELALALTGWSHGGYRRGGDEAVHGRFQFVRRQHEPGARRVLGRSYAEGGRRAGGGDPARSRASSGDGAASRDQTGAAFHRR